MASDLQLYLLGSPQIIHKQRLLTELTSSKAQALLYYLAVTGRPHTRAALAALLWGNVSDTAARANLRKALQQLREHLAPWFSINRDSVALAHEATIWVDVSQFDGATRSESGAAMDRLRQAIDLYRGDFLQGFYIRHAPEFEAWWLSEQARLREQALKSLNGLAAHYASQGELDQAMTFTRRFLALEPWREEAHRRLMLWLAQCDQRGAALAQYEICRRTLADELDVEPAVETIRLYERIRDGEPMPSVASTLQPVDTEPHLPAFLEQHAEVLAASHLQESFVGRELQLGRLEGFLGAALAGQGQVAFVSGEAGWGKTRLLEEFSRRVQTNHPDLIVAAGSCTTTTGLGNPYLPFREILRTLAADIEQKWTAGSISHAHALRLWRFFPNVFEALTKHGRHLVGAFVSEETLLQQAAVHEAIDQRLLKQMERLTKQTRDLTPIVEQRHVFAEFGDVLQTLARRQPLLLILDDLHWADASSVNLLFHLGRQLTGSPVLILGAYRPEEITLLRDGGQHPLAVLLTEFRRLFGDVRVDLEHVQPEQGQVFVDALLDLEPNRLDREFRQMLVRHTGAHPLFTVETLRDMKEQGDLIRDAAGRWIARSALNWNTLPPRVEGMIETRIRRLDDDLRGLLAAASVEGETFTVQVLARVQGKDERDLVRRLNQDGDRRHRLVHEQGIKRVGGRRLSIYRFRHNLFQRYLHSDLSESERAFLHEDVGNALEDLYGQETGEITVELASHFQAAGTPEKAIPYLHQAGDRAIQLSANAEAIAHLSRGLELLSALPSTPERSHQELAMTISLGEAQRYAGQISAAMDTYRRSASIARELGVSDKLALAALGFEEARWRYNLPAAPAATLLEEALDALDDEDSVLRVRVLGGLVRALLATGTTANVETMAQEAVTAARQLDDPLALYDTLRIYLFANRHPSASDTRISSANEMVRLAEAMGNQERLAEALGSRIHEHLERGDIRAMDADLKTHKRVREELGQPFFSHTGAMFRATRLTLAGDFAEAERQAQRALQMGQQIGTEKPAGVFGVQMFSIRREQGRLRSLAPIVKHFVEQNPASATWRPGLALVYCELGWEPEARALLEEMAADDFTDIPRDAFWVSTLAYLSEVCATLHDGPRAALLYDMLLPYNGYNVVAGFATACYGAASHFLGLLATTQSYWNVAERHFGDALEMNSRMGARPCLAHTQYQYALMLLARGQGDDGIKAKRLLDAAILTAAELGMEALVEKATALIQTVPDS